MLVVGGGGREHALLWKLAQSPRVGKLYAAPGNGGTGALARNVPLAVDDFDALVAFAAAEGIHLTVVGPDDPLAAGIVDRFEAADLRVFGPTAAAAQLESSKVYSKRLMDAAGVPTARYETFDSKPPALEHLEGRALPVVVKASGLALGKGDFVCHTLEQARDAVEAIMGERVFGAAGSEVVIEDYLVGPEISLHALCDGSTYTMLPSAQDHKPAGDGDEGPNTGGMGTIVPVPWLDGDDLRRLGETVVAPALAQQAATGSPFAGLLYPGLILTSASPRVLEFNARWGDPETQSYVRLLDSDLLDLLDACVDGRLAGTPVRWQPGYAACVIVASGGYPGECRKGLPISGLDAAEACEDVVVFHSATAIDAGRHVTAGGRVLGVSATGKTLESALDKAYGAVERIAFDGMRYRTDIGRRPWPEPATVALPAS